MKLRTYLITATTLACLMSCGDRGKSVPATPVSGTNHQAGMIGMTAPDITLPAWHNSKITSVRLGAYRGKWLVLFFYPADFTHVCPTELKELAEYYSAFTDEGAEILSISTDSEEVHRAWHKTELKDIPYPMVSDRAGRLCRMMGTYNNSTGRSARATFLVDPDRRIVAYEFHHDDIGRSSDELLRKLSAAVQVRKGHGGLCPAGWKQGDELLRPGSNHGEK